MMDSWQADVYASDFVPSSLHSINDAQLNPVPPPSLPHLDPTAYLAAFASLFSSDHHPLERKTSYSHADFHTLLDQEQDAHQAFLHQHRLFAFPLTYLGGESQMLFRLDLPGLRDGTPMLFAGDHVLLRQVLVSRVKGKSKRYDSTGLECVAVIQSVDRARERLFIQTQGLISVSPLLANISFPVPVSHYAACHAAVQYAETSSWMHTMRYPSDTDRCPQTTLPSINFDRLVWHDPSLNYEQKKAVHAVVRQAHGNLPFLIYGPPGSGKTKTVCEMVLQTTLEESRGSILLCAPSNPAADTLALRLRSDLTPTQMFRLQDSSRPFAEVPDPLLPYCHVENDHFALPNMAALMQKRLVITTCRDAQILVRVQATNRHMAQKSHDLWRTLYPFHESKTYPCHWLCLIIDEAAQATEPETLIPLSVVSPHGDLNGHAMPACVFVGDQHQLDSRLYSSSNLHISMFERLAQRSPYSTINKSFVPASIQLLRNYRSHPAILAVPSMLFYANTLIPEAIHTSSLLSWFGSPFPVRFHANEGLDSSESLRHAGTGWVNVSEVRIALDYASSLLEQGVIPADICLMSPFAAQVRRLRQAARSRRLVELNIGPMEAFQGLESRVVIICTTRARQRFLAADANKRLGIVGNRKKFNVALTRAKEGLIVIGNPWVLATDVYWDAFLRFCHRNNLVRVEKDTNHWHPQPRPDDENIAAGIPELEQAIKYARGIPNLPVLGHAHQTLSHYSA